MDSLLQKAKQYEPAISKLAIDEENKQNVWHLALSHKSHNVVDYLLNLQDDALLTSDYKIQRSEKEGDRNALHILIEQKDIKRAKQVINTVETPFDMVNTKTPEIIKDQRPRLLACLHLAASYDLKELVEQFLEDDLAGVDDVSDYKDTALMFSARWGNYAIAKTLIENNASIDKENDNGSTALYWAVRYRHVKIVELLLLNGANPNKERKVGLVAPLIAASAYGYNDIVNLLLHEPKCNKQIKDQKGQKAIHHAAREGNEDVLKTLIEKGEQHIDDKDNRKNTPLLLAAQRKRNTNVVFELIIHGADDLHENKERKHSWHYALDSKDSNLLDSLMAACIEKKKDMNKRQPLLIAAKIGRLEMIQYLLAYQQGPLEYPQDPQKNSFLHIAALHDQSDIIDKFHTRKEINSKNDKGDTPLHIACRNGFDKTIKTLLKCKAKTSIKNKEEETPLHVAAKSKKLNAKSVSELVSFTKMHAWACLDALDSTESNCLHLAGKTAEPDAIWAFKYVTLDKYDKDGYTPLHKAVRAGQPEALGKYITRSLLIQPFKLGDFVCAFDSDWVQTVFLCIILRVIHVCCIPVGHMLLQKAHDYP